MLVLSRRQASKLVPKIDILYICAGETGETQVGSKEAGENLACLLNCRHQLPSAANEYQSGVIITLCQVGAN